MADIKFQQLSSERVPDDTIDRAIRSIREAVRELQVELRKLERRVEALE